jgi:hypothetical protein
MNNLMNEFQIDLLDLEGNLRSFSESAIFLFFKLSKYSAFMRFFELNNKFFLKKSYEGIKILNFFFQKWSNFKSLANQFLKSLRFFYVIILNIFK